MRTPKLPPAVEAKAKKGPGRYGLADAGFTKGLYLHVRESGTRCWVFRYRDKVTGKLRDKGLGCMPEVSLKDANEAAQNALRGLREGADPIDAPRQAREAAQLAQARKTSFGDCCTKYIKAHRAGWRNAKHAAQWRSTLDTYAADLLPLPVQAIDTGLVLRVLEPIWTNKTETATRVRQRIEAVLDWATVRGHRSGENPARWRGHLDKLLPKPSKVKRVTHLPAMPYADVPAYMTTLAGKVSITSRALRFQILTATRPGEAVGALWAEIDLDRKTWTIPADRMKAHREHVAALSAEAVKLLRSIGGERKGFVFDGKPERSLTIAAPLALLQESHPSLTCHGFRSSFRDWAAERTNYPREVVEAALAHTVKDKTEAAYFRSDLLQRRAKLMEEWARFCATPNKASDNVTPLRKVSGKRR